MPRKVSRVVGSSAMLCAMLASCADSIAPRQKTLAFTVQPSHTTPGSGISPSIQVAVFDADGVHMQTAVDPITLTVAANPAGGLLVGTVTLNAVNGVATFPSVSLTKAGLGYTLNATAPSLHSGPSAPFHVVLTMTTMAGGAVYSCASGPDGTYCWGLNNSSQLGNGNTITSHAPVPVSGGPTFTALYAGGGHGCGLTAAGGIQCWGPNGAGELGNGTTTYSRVPTPSAGGATFLSLSEGGTGSAHTCAIRADSTAVCWGRNSNGQLGHGTTTDYDSVPVLVLGGLRFRALTAGGAAHSCGITTDSAAYCWGGNVHGRLGTGTTSGTNVPVPVAGALRFVQISAGGAHTCGVEATGAAYCWGTGSAGELGNGLSVDDSVPVLVTGGLQFTAVTSGLTHSCGRTTTGAGYCWGGNGSGQLGNGPGPASASPVPIAGGLSFTTIRAGQFHTCGIATNGAAYCWGSNSSGQLGDGTNTTRYVPTLVHVVP